MLLVTHALPYTLRFPTQFPISQSTKEHLDLCLGALFRVTLTKPLDCHTHCIYSIDCRFSVDSLQILFAYLLQAQVLQLFSCLLGESLPWAELEENKNNLLNSCDIKLPCSTMPLVCTIVVYFSCQATKKRPPAAFHTKTTAGTERSMCLPQRRYGSSIHQQGPKLLFIVGAHMPTCPHFLYQMKNQGHFSFLLQDSKCRSAGS